MNPSRRGGAIKSEYPVSELPSYSESMSMPGSFDTGALDIFNDEIGSPDVLIAVMGVTGSGKSTFINHLSDVEVFVGHKLESYTLQPAVFPATLPNGRRIYLMDTPGFDDTYKKDSDVLREIADKLNETYGKKVLLSGIVFMHDISATRMNGAAMRNLRMFKKLCGAEGLSSVVLTTTMWSEPPTEKEEQRERELQNEDQFWKQMIGDGSRTFRHNHGRDSALAIVEYLIGKQETQKRQPLAVQREMVDNNRRLDETAAGKIVEADLVAEKAAWLREKSFLEQELQEARNAKDPASQKQIASEIEDMNKKVTEWEKNWESLKVEKDQLAEQLRLQKEAEAKTGLAYNAKVQAAVVKLEKKEGRWYRKWNPFHVRYDEK